MQVATSSSTGSDMHAGKGIASVTKRLQSELMQLMMSGDKDATAFPQGDNLFEWVGTIVGANGTVYEGLTYKLSPIEYGGNGGTNINKMVQLLKGNYQLQKRILC